MSNKSSDNSGSLPVADRLIFLIFFIIVFIPMLHPLGLPIPITPPTREFYNAVLSVPNGGVVLIDDRNGFATWADISPGEVALYKQLFQIMREKNVRLIFFSGAVEGNQNSQRVLREFVGQPYPFNTDPAYGKTWVHLGWIPGEETILAGMVNDMISTAPSDLYGTPTKDMEIFKYVANKAAPFDKVTGDDINLFAAIHSGTPEAWIRQWSTFGDSWGGNPHGNIIEIFSAGVIPWATPFIEKGQMRSYIGGQRGGAEYEILTANPGSGSSYMDAQDFAHLFAITLIVGMNVWYLIGKSKGGLKK